MNHPLNKIIAMLILISGFSIPLSVNAELVAQERAAEANQVRVLFTKGVEQGMVQVEQCSTCPLNLGIDGQTRFFHNGKEIARNRVGSFSGKPGTVIYSLDGKQALRIRW